MSLLGAQKISSEQDIIKQGCAMADGTIYSLSCAIADVKEINESLKKELAGEMNTNFTKATEYIELHLNDTLNFLIGTNDEVRWNASRISEIEQQAIAQIGGDLDE